jgi:DNA polymerase-1
MIVARTGSQLVSFDYSQLELRVLAYLSKDEKLQAQLLNDTDFFISLAADLLKKPKYEITHEQRQNAKQVDHFLFYSSASFVLNFRFVMGFSMECQMKHLHVKHE